MDEGLTQVSSREIIDIILNFYRLRDFLLSIINLAIQICIPTQSPI